MDTSLVVCFVNANNKITLKYLDKSNEDTEAVPEIVALNPDDIRQIIASMSAALDDYCENYEEL